MVLRSDSTELPRYQGLLSDGEVISNDSTVTEPQMDAFSDRIRKQGMSLLV